VDGIEHRHAFVVAHPVGVSPVAGAAQLHGDHDRAIDGSHRRPEHSPPRSRRHLEALWHAPRERLQPPRATCLPAAKFREVLEQ
jgi:hypothetical protein